MDELEISGKRYISTRLAARQHHYHSDYIGQLIRAGKVNGQKVGRSWYVQADSLSAYLKKGAGPVTSVESNHAPEPSVTSIEQVPEGEAVLVEPETVTEPPAFPQATLMPRPLQTDHSFAPARIVEEETHKVPIKKVATPAKLRYLPEEAPRLPVLEKNTRESTPLIHWERSSVLSPQHASVTRSRFAPGIIVLITGILAFIFMALISTYVVSVTTVKNGEPASTRYALDTYLGSF